MMVLPLQRGGPTSSAATGDDKDDVPDLCKILSHTHSLKFHHQTLCKLYMNAITKKLQSQASRRTISQEL